MSEPKTMDDVRRDPDHAECIARQLHEASNAPILDGDDDLVGLLAEAAATIRALLNAD